MSRKARSTFDLEPEVRSASSGELDLDHVRAAIQGIRYGEVRVIIQDGIVIQIERVEKQRLR